MLFYCMSLFYLVVIIGWVIKIFYSKKCLDFPKEYETGAYVDFVLVIPVLNEVNRIRDAIERCALLADEHTSVVFVTTSREKELKNAKNTIDILEEYKEKYEWLHTYKYSGMGYMAHQLNYGIKQYIREYFADENTLFAVYNIDSVIEKETLKWVENEYLKRKQDNIIFQQYGIYTKNVASCRQQSGLWRKSILLSNMLWQTRWSTGFEIVHALWGIKSAHSKTWFMNYCIGHGLFFNRNTYEKIGGFEEQSLNEDAIFGLQACFNNIPIIPIPRLEYADSPDMVESLFKQKVTWIYGPGQAFLYKKLIQSRRKLSRAETFRLFLLCAQLFEHAVRWVMMPMFCMAYIVLATVEYSIWGGIVSVLMTVFYLSGINLLNYLYVCGRKSDFSARDMVMACLGCIPQFVMHGCSGILGLYQLLKDKIFHKGITKKKTEMRE